MSLHIYQPLLKGTYQYLTPAEAAITQSGTFHLYDVSVESLTEIPFYNCFSFVLASRSITEREIRMLSMTSRALWNALQIPQTFLTIKSETVYNFILLFARADEPTLNHLPFFSLIIDRLYPIHRSNGKQVIESPEKVVDRSLFLKEYQVKIDKNIYEIVPTNCLEKTTQLTFKDPKFINAGLISHLVLTNPHLHTIFFCITFHDKPSLIKYINIFCKSVLIPEIKHLTYIIGSMLEVNFQTIKPLINTLPHLKLDKVCINIRNSHDYQEYGRNNQYHSIVDIGLREFQDANYLMLLGIVLGADDSNLQSIHINESQIDIFPEFFRQTMSQPESRCEFYQLDDIMQNYNTFMLTPFGKKIQLCVEIDPVKESPYFDSISSANLQHLSFDTNCINKTDSNPFVSFVKRFPNIKSLQITRQYEGPIENLEELPILHNLETLDFDSMPNLTREHITQLIQKMPNLKKISIGCFNGSADEAKILTAQLNEQLLTVTSPANV